MSSLQRRLQENVAGVLARIETVCRRAGRDSASVRLVAVTKYAELEWVRGLVELGVPALGESRPQQLVDRAGRLDDRARWHLIGHLQRNKVRAVLPHVELIHSVDSASLLRRIDQISGQLGRRPRILLQVNVSGEATKHGFSTDELAGEIAQLVQLSHVEIVGLMTMAPLSDDPEAARRSFRGLRELRDRLRGSVPGGPSLDELSMGMSHDFEVAVEEGATFIRIGSLLYEGLTRSEPG